ncbi:ANTAR domain-containing protein [Rhodococcus globerulus]|uniref:ANTAR domain-containing protein n=1 Tax=Rhodococcus globerulus TaxID=33008 RepID=UPI003CC8A4E5
MPIQSVARTPPSGFFNRFRLPRPRVGVGDEPRHLAPPKSAAVPLLPDNHRWVRSSALEAAARDDKRGRAAGALRDAIGARVDVERAVGVVMNQNDCDASVAFRELETRSATNSDNILM